MSGMQLMLIRDLLREGQERRTRWTKFIYQACQVLEDSGEHATHVGKTAWTDMVKAATQRVLESIQRGPIITGENICIAPECLEESMNGIEGGHC